MTEPRSWVTVGSAPRVVRIQALAFHDAAGQIQHMHHAITLEGAEPRSYDAMLEDATTHAREMGVDLERLKVLHVKTPFDLNVAHTVDVKKGVLIPVKTPRLGEAPPRAARPARRPARQAKRR
jgi:hypothetical protein